MFRKPREIILENISSSSKPSTGRPPTPPNVFKSDSKPETMTTRSSTERMSSTKPLTPRPNSKNNVTILGRQSGKKAAVGKTPGKANASILTFFKKVDGPLRDDGGLFIPQSTRGDQDRFGDVDEGTDIYGTDDEERFNEVEVSVKKRRFSLGPPDTNNVGMGDVLGFPGLEIPAATTRTGGCTPPPFDETTVTKPKVRKIGGFIDDSDNEEDHTSPTNSKSKSGVDRILQRGGFHTDESNSNKSVTYQPSDMNRDVERCPEEQIDLRSERIVSETSTILSINGINGENNEVHHDGAIIPSLKQEDSNFDDFAGFNDIEEFNDDDEFAHGEEFVQRKWAEEQARMEAAENGELLLEDKIISSCPICEGSLEDLPENEASRHVNACLDGKPIPIRNSVKSELKEVKIMPPGAGSRFSRAAIARPGQANPFAVGGNAENAPSSAFSKLMASHAEDTAWANAAAAENAARGKAAYQRTCPFYKIMPGFFICVDAFRYGAVQGCKAYFLSHFHSDHYIGLTSTWCHGPIYCSKVTGNLVKQFLRVDPKWVVSLDFESKFEIPGTEGVAVTMIPANHCPGSSLYLFEKKIGKGANPKFQRVLHCGDFRACPAHVEHPLLMPDIVDSISGRTKQQKIDVCYLDTTYLNPKYAFPSQEDVIKSCADMCVSLSKDKADESDAWEQVKKERAGAGMVKFIGSNAKSEESIAMEVGSNKARGRLLVVCGTYSIGKERICMGIARALGCKIWAPPGKQRICAALEDPELSSRLTDDPREAQIHMQMLMEIRAETLQDYLNGFKPHFSRIVGFRPSGWNYRPPNSRFLESPSVHTVLASDNWRSRYSMSELVPQRGSTREASCFGVPYSEHSSFRELTLFCCALRIEKIVPTVNVGSAASRAKMKTWIDRWLAERRKNGVVKIGRGAGEVQW